MRWISVTLPCWPALTIGRVDRCDPGETKLVWLLSLLWQSCYTVIKSWFESPNICRMVSESWTSCVVSWMNPSSRILACFTISGKSMSWQTTSSGSSDTSTSSTFGAFSQLLSLTPMNVFLVFWLDSKLVLMCDILLVLWPDLEAFWDLPRKGLLIKFVDTSSLYLRIWLSCFPTKDSKLSSEVAPPRFYAAKEMNSELWNLLFSLFVVANWFVQWVPSWAVSWLTRSTEDRWLWFLCSIRCMMPILTWSMRRASSFWPTRRSFNGVPNCCRDGEARLY